MKYTIAIHSAPYSGNGGHTGLAFARALLAAGHEIARVFFYHEGVYHALTSAVAPQGEADSTAAWRAFHAETGTELAVCIANGIKRGVLSVEESERYERTAATLAPGFELVGLGQLIDAIVSSDRYIEFPQ